MNFMPQLNKTCSIPGCDKKHHGRDLCCKHYQRVHSEERRKALPIKLPTVAKICSVNDCGAKHHGRGFCKKHYRRDVKQRIKENRARNKITYKACKENGCNAPVKGRGLCNLHYKRLRKQEAAKPEFRPVAPIQKIKLKPEYNTCKIKGCSLAVRSRDCCERHYRSLLRYGDPKRTDQIQKEKELRVANKNTPCKIEGCNAIKQKSGYCYVHYYRERQARPKNVNSRQGNTQPVRLDFRRDKQIDPWAGFNLDYS